MDAFTYLTQQDADEYCEVLPEDQLVSLTKQMLGAIKHCHSHNVIHRDLKLENVLVSLGPKGEITELKIADFGMAKQIKTGNRPSRTSSAPYLTTTTS